MTQHVPHIEGWQTRHKRHSLDSMLSQCCTRWKAVQVGSASAYLKHTEGVSSRVPCSLASLMLCFGCRVDCCLYAVNMGYHSSVGNTTAAVTTDNTSAIAIACPTTSTVQWQTADLTVTTASSPGAANVTTIYDVTNTSGNDTTYVAKVVVEPSYQVCSSSCSMSSKAT